MGIPLVLLCLRSLGTIGCLLLNTRKIYPVVFRGRAYQGGE